jgi:multiple antibiotic resistance protein
MTIASAGLLLFLVMDPLGNIPFFLTALKRVDAARQRTVVVRELLIALGVLVCFLFAGRYVLELLHISEPALTAAGGVILLLIAVRMIFPSPEKTMQEEFGEEPFIVPLAIPYVAGPSALSTELLLTSREPNRWPEWLIATCAAWLVCSVILYFASGFRHLLGQRGLVAVERLMGMVLVTIAVQMLMTGIGQFVSLLPNPENKEAAATVGGGCQFPERRHAATRSQRSGHPRGATAPRCLCQHTLLFWTGNLFGTKRCCPGGNGPKRGPNRCGP